MNDENMAQAMVDQNDGPIYSGISVAHPKEPAREAGPVLQALGLLERELRLLDEAMGGHYQKIMAVINPEPKEDSLTYDPGETSPPTSDLVAQIRRNISEVKRMRRWLETTTERVEL